MSALNWILFDDAAVLVGDTRGIEAACFGSQVIHLGHARSLVATMGLGVAQRGWLLSAVLETPARDVTGVTQALRAMLAQLGPESHPGPAAAAYAFGWDLAAGQMRGFGYTAAKGFAEERLRYGFGLNPPIGINIAEIDSMDTFFTDIVVRQHAEEAVRQHAAEAVRQRAEAESAAPGSAAGIGGEVVIHKLTEDTLETKTLYCFADCKPAG
jgi:hypothetical protein